MAPLFLCLAVLAVVLHLLGRFITPKVDQHEPPILKPHVPLIGHILGLAKHQANYFSVLRTRTTKPVVTMPLLNKKNYIIFSPHLIQQAMRHRDLDFDLIGLAFARQVAALSDQALGERVRKGPSTYTAETVAGIKSGLQGRGIKRMTAAMLAHVGSQLNGFDAGRGLPVPSLWVWVRDMMTMATAEAFYGHANPFRADPAGLGALWDFDGALGSMLFLPPAMARAGAGHRDRMVSTLRPYFDGRMDLNEDASEFVALRTAASVKYKVLGDDLCKSEVINIWVSTANSIPALFWTLINVLSRPELAARIRDEVLPVVTFSAESGPRTATLDVALVEKKCPLLLSCQRETMRAINHAVARRAVTEDVHLTDEDGTTYVLRKGNDVMWSSKVAHEMAEAWGPDAGEFDPERFVGTAGGAQADKEAEKRRRAAYMPFGGGSHLCPGRNFASAEALGLVSALVVGYEVEGLRAGEVRMGPRELASAMPKPAADGDGGAVTIRRRRGWDEVQWSFAC